MKCEFARLYYNPEQSIMDITGNGFTHREFEAQSSFYLLGILSAEGWCIVHVIENASGFRYEIWLQREIMPRLTIRRVEAVTEDA